MCVFQHLACSDTLIIYPGYQLQWGWGRVGLPHIPTLSLYQMSTYVNTQVRIRNLFQLFLEIESFNVFVSHFFLLHEAVACYIYIKWSLSRHYNPSCVVEALIHSSVADYIYPAQIVSPVFVLFACFRRPAESCPFPAGVQPTAAPHCRVSFDTFSGPKFVGRQRDWIGTIMQWCMPSLFIVDPDSDLIDQP